MRERKRIFVILCCTAILFSYIFMCFSIPVHAKPTLDENGHLHVYNWDDIKDCAVDWVMYMASLAGAIFKDRDFAKYVQNKEAWVDHWNEDNVKISENGTSVTFSKELMAFIKQCIDEYLKTEQTKEENGGFYLIPTTKFTDVPANQFNNSYEYQTFRNIMLEKGGIIYSLNYNRYVDLFSDPEHPKSMYFSNSSYLNSYLNNPESIVRVAFMCAYDWESENKNYPLMMFEDENKVYKSFEDAVKVNYLTNPYIDGFLVNGYDNRFSYVLFTTTGERVRVFVSQNAAKNYSVGSRKVFVTNNYYDYEPEDLSVTIDDLTKGISDLQDIIDELMRRITDDTTEREIMELLRLILEEMRNQHSTGGGGGSGGDVTVNVDLSTTNNWLSKIYEKVSQIYKKMNSAVEDAENTALARIQESLEEIIVQLKKIKRWAAVDTVIDGVDAIADWLDLIRGVISDADEGAESAVTAVADTLTDSTDMLRTKFPFSIPWDILFFVTVFAAEPQIPYFEIPIDIEMAWADINIHYDFVIDFTQFQWLSDVSRLVLSMTYAVGLMKLTMNIALLKKEG